MRKSKRREMEESMERAIEQAYYIKGLNDAWEMLKKIIMSDENESLSCESLIRIFGSDDYECILKNNNPLEAIEKIKDYESGKNKINVGDVVYHVINKTRLFLVMRIYEDSSFDALYLSAMMFPVMKQPYYYATIRINDLSNYRKVERHCNLNEIFKIKE